MAVYLATKQDGSDRFALPFAKISIDASNEVVRRQVAKGYYHGSVKESWNRADYEITITGWLLTEPDANGNPVPPSETIAKLSDWFSRSKALRIFSTNTRDVGVDQVVILSWSFPFTPGIQNQAYSIKCVSDYPFELLV